MKKISIIIALWLAFFGLSIGTLRAQTWNIGSPTATDVTATLSGSTLTISGTGAMMNWDWDSPWYSVSNNITIAVIDSGVTTIGANAFAECDNLTTVTIPNSVTTIGAGAFYACINLTSATIGNSVTTIGAGAFAFCSSLTSVTIPNLVTSIGNQAFGYCYGLTSVTIPNSVTSIGDGAFRGCIGLTSIDVASGNSVYSSDNGVLFNLNKTTLIQYPAGKVGGYAIPDSVTSIENQAFAHCRGLTSVTIPNSVTSIGDGAFRGCIGLTSIDVASGNSVYSSDNGVLFNKNKTTLIQCPEGKSGTYAIPNSVTSIGNDAFAECKGLTSVTIPNSVTSIGNLAFDGCRGLTSVTIPNSVTSIGTHAFRYCSSLWTVNVGWNSPLSITAYVFGGVNVETVFLRVPDGKVSVYNAAAVWQNFAIKAASDNTSDCFSGTIDALTWQICSDGAFSISGSGSMPNYTSITTPWKSFKDRIKTVNIANNVTSIGKWAFYDCYGLTSVTIPNSVTSIGDFAFYYCSGLTSVTIPNSVTSIGEWAFAACSGLTSIYVKAATPPTVSNNTFRYVPTATPLHVPCGQQSVYQAAQYWSNFTNIVDDVAPEVLSVFSADYTMGTASITRMNTCTDPTAIIAATPKAGYRFVQWSDGDTNNPRTITVTQDTTFTAEFISEVGIAETQALSSIRIYPNPTHDQLNIESDTYIIYSIQITDMAGKTILTASPINHSVNVSRLPSGVYFLKIETDKGVVVKKVIKN